MRCLDKNEIQRSCTLDFIRAFAMLYIVAIHHVDDYANQIFSCILDELLTYSFLGMFVFLSGYLLALRNEVASHNDFVSFLKKRFVRIFPLYLFSLILFQVFFSDKFSIFSLLKHFFMVNMFTGGSVFTLWFVSMLCVYYLLFPLFVYRYTRVRGLFTTILLYSFVIVLHLVYAAMDERLFIYLPLFSLGVVVAKDELMSLLQEKQVLLVSTIVAVGGGIMFFATQGGSVNYVVHSFYMVSTVPLVLYLGQVGITLVPVNIYSKLAYASFCMYLFHRIIYYLLLKIYYPPTNILTVCYLVLIGVPVIYVISAFVQKSYNKLIMIGS